MNLIVIDDDIVVTTSLKTIIQAAGDFSVIATGNNGNDAITLYKEYKPDVVLLDIRMEPKNGLEAAKEILEFDSNAKILFLTTFQDDEYIIKALHLGVKGYLLKQDFESIVPAITAVYSGQTVFGSEIVSKIPRLITSENEKKTSADTPLTEKEYEIVEEVAKGLSNKEIAESLFLSEGTVRNYLSKILEKLELRDRTQLAIYYYKNIAN